MTSSSSPGPSRYNVHSAPLQFVTSDPSSQEAMRAKLTDSSMNKAFEEARELTDTREFDQPIVMTLADQYEALLAEEPVVSGVVEQYSDQFHNRPKMPQVDFSKMIDLKSREFGLSMPDPLIAKIFDRLKGASLTTAEIEAMCVAILCFKDDMDLVSFQQGVNKVHQDMRRMTSEVDDAIKKIETLKKAARDSHQLIEMNKVCLMDMQTAMTAISIDKPKAPSVSFDLPPPPPIQIYQSELDYANRFLMTTFPGTDIDSAQIRRAAEEIKLHYPNLTTDGFAKMPKPLRASLLWYIVTGDMTKLLEFRKGPI